jgi:hypothetical protein
MSSVIKALKFLGPHLLGMMRDAVEKWNDTVPGDMVPKYIEDMSLIRDKLSHLPNFETEVNGVSLEKSVEGLCSEPYDTGKIVALAAAYTKYLEGLYVQNATDMIVAVCDKDVQALARIYNRGDKLLERFRDSFRMNEVYGLRSGEYKAELRIVDDAISGLSRIMPNRKLSPDGTLILRDLQRVFHPKVSSEELEQMKVRFSSLYEIRVYSSLFTHTSVLLVPRLNFISEDSLKEVYPDMEVSQTTIFELMKSTVSEWWIKEDPNVSPGAILNKVLGSSITSLSTVVTDLMVYLFLVLRTSDTNRNESDADVSKKLMSGPWASVESTQLFVSPIDLYDSLANTDRIRSGIQGDFTLMLDFLSTYRLHISDYNNGVFNRVRGAPRRERSNITYPSMRSPPEYVEYRYNVSNKFSSLAVDKNLQNNLFALLGHAWYGVKALNDHGRFTEAEHIKAPMVFLMKSLGYNENSCGFEQ